ncbi:radical SAM protein [Sulfuracidifex metallicus]|uniref:Radical SAM protein n=1 Tax=Sulfuracidifex metallicus DSM 6482 = JCM 9184 TaxID=523847 RepID=A0A6A9QKW6_SULME|nr:radical SAM protein [Sulfuracidifex metallicus]MUN29646.1 radical SAM protein [Sulfuracidifex metallicus DSM 6482 = JCM 9184]WOE49847.1 radical SAM protein [Sulfuracidifex metallicus DSM 6482 = JCM 9184]
MKLLFSSGTFFFITGKARKYSNTAYALQDGGCQGKCAFCSQSTLSSAPKNFLSRVKWYSANLEDFSDIISSNFMRFCLQTVYKPNFDEEALEIMKTVKTRGKSITTVPVDELKRFLNVGVDYLGVGLDTTESMFPKVGKPFSFSTYMDFIREGVKIFGKGKVFVHLVFGLGESLDEFLNLMQEIYNIGAEVALFAFTPVKGTPMENNSPPSLHQYRLVQTVRYYLSRGIPLSKLMRNGELTLPSDSTHYLTSGCPTCDRPFYNESPTAPIPYNFSVVMKD